MLEQPLGVHHARRRLSSQLRFKLHTNMSAVTRFAKSILKTFNVGITKCDKLESLQAGAIAEQRVREDLRALLSLLGDSSPRSVQRLEDSQAQLKQDLFVLTQLNFKRNGFFVEFGATDGIGLSNTYLLEKQYGWSGILAEPAACWHSALARNRNAKIETMCVWKDSTSALTFKEAEIAEFSTIDAFSGSDGHVGQRKQGKSYQVKTISLNDLLLKYDAPQTIDYLSIDTEGSEFEILRNFDFNKYSFRVITCEHNFTPKREQIHELLAKNGYERKLETLSQWDDWYVQVT
jgi:FkbM family methyltransferase